VRVEIDAGFVSNEGVMIAHCSGQVKERADRIKKNRFDRHGL